MMRATLLSLVLAASAMLSPAQAWTRPGHMVSAVIAYDDLAARDPTTLHKISELIAQHPDRAAFEVASAGSSGPERDARRFMECARWPDDARGTPYDHPTWHYADRPIDTRAQNKGRVKPADQNGSGQAIEALNLNFKEAANARAPIADRALALCWLMHVAGDMHQPLHAASLYSETFKDGDEGGNRQWVIDPVTNEAVSLHWFWDNIVNRDDKPQNAMDRARELETKFPRATLKELQAYAPSDFFGWAFGDTWKVAANNAYPADLKTGLTKETAQPLAPAYRATARDIAERRMAIAGYRIADLLKAIAEAT